MIEADMLLTILSVAGGLCAVLISFAVYRKSCRKDTDEATKSDATVLTEIGYIKANTDEIKAEQREQRKTNTEFVTRLTAVEQSAKQAHKRIDRIEGEDRE